MAHTNRSTQKNCRQQKPTARKQVKGKLVQTFLDTDRFFLDVISARMSDPSLEVLTRSQRLQLASLAQRTGKPVEVWVRRAVENFLADELPIRMLALRRAA